MTTLSRSILVLRSKTILNMFWSVIFSFYILIQPVYLQDNNIHGKYLIRLTFSNRSKCWTHQLYLLMICVYLVKEKVMKDYVILISSSKDVNRMLSRRENIMDHLSVITVNRSQSSLLCKLLIRSNFKRPKKKRSLGNMK